MAYLKTEHVHAHNKAINASLKLKVYVSTDGQFYCSISEEYIESAIDAFKHQIIPNNGKIKLFADSLEELKNKVYKTLANHINPEVSETPVILYNIESHVLFAEDKEGNIYPNSGFDGAEWAGDDKYGRHYANTPSPGGYSLTIGAVAYIKTTHKYGEKEKIEYDRYYKDDGDHHGHDNPAELLNSWCSFSIPDDAKEIPYTDEAALFFHNLMLGMAKLSLMIQNSTFDQGELLKLIESGSNSLLLSAPKE